MDKLFDNHIKDSIGTKMDSIKASDDLIAKTLARINMEREQAKDAKSSKSSNR